MTPQARPEAGRSDLVAVALPQGHAAASAIADLWRDGAAVFPVDDRLPQPVLDRVLERLRPSHVLDADGLRRVAEGPAVQEDIGVIVATSGTEGEPRLVELPRAAITAAVERSLAALGAEPDAGWLCALPFAHIGGLLVVLRAAITGATVEVLGRFDPDAIGASRARFVALVPTQLRRLVDAGTDLARFDAILVGGADLDAGLRAAAEGRGARIVHTYGMTETCGGVVYDGVALPDVDVSVRDDGRIVVGGPTLLRRYRADADATAAAFDDRGRFVTADLGRLHKDGRLEVLGRADDAITTGGETVMPLAVEAVLATHPSVDEVAVVGRPDAEWGERVVAVVVPRGAPPALDDLRAHVRATLPTWAAPRELVLVEALPRTISGKVRRAEVRALLG